MEVLRSVVVVKGNGFPEIVTLCGSTRFKEQYESEQARLTDEGVIVISVGRFGHRDGLEMDGDHKKMLDELHLRKIDLSDRIHVVNPVVLICIQCTKPVEYDPKWGGYRCNECSQRQGEGPSAAYVGESTKREINYALSKGKKITYLNPSESTS